MVRIRLKRMGRRNRPFYRVNVVDKEWKRDGKVIENLGWYDPVASDPAKQSSLKDERIKHWISKGAMPSDTVWDLLRKHEIVDEQTYMANRGARVAARKEIHRKKKEAEDAAAKAAAEAKAAEAKPEGA